MKVNYTIAKRADQSTEFVINKIVDIDDRLSRFSIQLSKNSPTTTFKELQPNDLLIEKEDYSNKLKDDVIEVQEIISHNEDETVFTAAKLSKIGDGSYGYSVDDHLLFLARAEFV